MERAEHAPESSDRERRAHLELLQTQLREAREALAQPEPPAPESLVELEAQMALAVEEAKATGARVAGLKLTLEKLRLEIEGARRSLEEDKVLALGKSRRDRYLDPLGFVKVALPVAAAIGYALIFVIATCKGH